LTESLRLINELIVLSSKYYLFYRWIDLSAHLFSNRQKQVWTMWFIVDLWYFRAVINHLLCVIGVSVGLAHIVQQRPDLCIISGTTWWLKSVHLNASDGHSFLLEASLCSGRQTAFEDLLKYLDNVYVSTHVVTRTLSQSPFNFLPCLLLVCWWEFSTLKSVTQDAPSPMHASCPRSQVFYNSTRAATTRWRWIRFKA